GQIARMYKELDLPNYDKAKPYFDEYLASVKNYKKNKFRNLRPEILERINREWRFAFEEWSYKIED
ncbi:MAG: sulfotransferase, partial [Bacteroidetes bacterium]|nr:sulfotransferase [Bacteroidota bacterium]